MTIGGLLVRAAQEYGDDEALVFPDARFTFRDLLREAEQVAAGLYALGVRRGDRVGLLTPNTPEFVHAFYGAALVGAVLVPVNARYKRRELGFVIANSDVTVLLTSDVIAEHTDFVELLRECFPDLDDAVDPEHLRLADAPLLRTIVLFGRGGQAGFLESSRLAELAAGVDPAELEVARAAVRSEDIALMPYTSGTTAQPKGCLLTHESLVREWVDGGELLDVRRGDRFWDPMPMFHMSGIGPLMFTVAVGAVFVSTTHFEPGPGLEQIKAERATHLFPLFPLVLMALLRDPDYAVDSFSDVRVVGHSAPAETLQVAAGLLPDRAVQVGFYGLTECCGTVATSRLDLTLEERMRNIVEPHPGVDIRIVDPETGREVFDQPGEIHVRGFPVFKGYYKEPELTAATLDADGWVHTGDLGSQERTRGLVYLGRLKDMLKVGGENVAPAEIESLLSTHPAVQVVQVVGAEDEKYGEVPIAFVQLVAGRSASEQELIDHCRGELASWKIPRGVRFIDEWPTSATKIQKNRLREMLKET